MPKVSVIIPTYNRSLLLSKAINSVLNQTYDNFELIIADDNSCDKTVETIKRIKDERIRYICSKTHLGPSGARNEGIKIARGEFIAFLDDDDEWVETKLQKQLDIFNADNKKLGLVYCGYHRINNPNAPAERIPEKEGCLHRTLLEENCIGGTSSIMVLRNCFKVVGLFDKCISNGEDWDMYIRIAKKFEIKYVKEPLVKYYYHSSNISNKKLKEAAELLKVIMKHNDSFSAYPQIYRKHIFEIALLFCKNNGIVQGRKLFGELLRVRPMDCKYLIYYFASLISKDSNSFNKFSMLKKQLERVVRK